MLQRWETPIQIACCNELVNDVGLWYLASVRCDAELDGLPVFMKTGNPALSASQRTWLDLPLGRPYSD